MESISRDFTIDLRKLRLLSELDRRGTLAATAAAMHLTPSAVSQQVAGLSRELGVPLLEHHGRGVSLTGQALLLLTHADAVQEQLERARAALDAWSTGTVGRVRVASLSTGISALVAPAMTRLRRERPELQVTVSEYDADDAIARLDNREVDVVVAVDFIGAPSRQDSRYHRVDLITDVMDAVLPIGHPLADPAGIKLIDLADEVWVGGEVDVACSQIAVGVCAAAGFTADIRHHCAEWDAVAALVAAGAGVALVPRLAQPLRQEGIVVCPVLGQPASRLLMALARAGGQADPGIAAMLAALRAVAADRPDGVIS